MSSAFNLATRRRRLVLGTVVFLLHWTVLDWLSGHSARAGWPQRPALVQAQLLPAPQPQAQQPAPLPLPRKSVRQAPLPDLAAIPMPEFAAADSAVAANPEPAITLPAEERAAEAVIGVESVAQPEPPRAALAPEPRRYQADVPPSSEMAMDVDRVDADGTHWSGEAQIMWKREGDSYRIKVEAGVRLIFARVNLVELTSEGAITPAGFAPAKMTEKRRGRALTSTHFNRQDGKITFSASQLAFPLQPGAQDKASVPLQLAAIARADPGQLSGDIEIQVGEDKDASVYRFVVLGQEETDTRLGRLATLHLSRPPKPGSYNSRLDVWLAPARGWYPVRMRNTEASGAVTTQTVSKIVMTDTGS